MPDTVVVQQPDEIGLMRFPSADPVRARDVATAVGRRQTAADAAKRQARRTAKKSRRANRA